MGRNAASSGGYKGGCSLSCPHPLRGEDDGGTARPGAGPALPAAGRGPGPCAAGLGHREGNCTGCCRAHSAWAGGAGWGRGPLLHPQAPASSIPEPTPGQLPGVPAQNQVSPDGCVQCQPTAGTPTRGAMMSPRACGTSPGNMGQVLHLYTSHGAGQGVLHAGRWQVPMLAWLVRTEGGRSLKRVTGPQRQRQVHCRLANFCSGLPGPAGRWQVAGPHSFSKFHW